MSGGRKMALNIKSIGFDELQDANRFDARYFFLQDTIERFSKNKSIQLVDLGEKELLLEITDGEHAGQTFVDDGVRFIKNSSVKDFDISLTDGFYITEYKHSLLQRSALKSNDILFTTIGHLGSATIVPDNFGEANINQNLVRMKINDATIDPYYLAAFLNSSFVRKQIDCLFTGNIQKILTYPKIKKIKIIKAKDTIQKQVRKYYLEAIKCGNDAWKSIVCAKNTIRTQLGLDTFSPLNNFSYEVDYNAVENGLWTPKYYFPKYVSTIEYLQSNFKCKPLSKLIKYKSGDEVGSNSYNSYLDKKDTDVPFVRTSDIYNYQYDICPDNFVDFETYEDLQQNIEVGNILFSNDGKIGMITMISQDNPIIVQSHINIIKLNTTEITPEYLYAMLMIEEINSYQSDKCTVIQSTIPTLAKRLNEFTIPILDDGVIAEVTYLIKQANQLFDKKRDKIKEIQNLIEQLIIDSVTQEEAQEEL